MPIDQPLAVLARKFQVSKAHDTVQQPQVGATVLPVAPPTPVASRCRDSLNWLFVRWCHNSLVVLNQTAVNQTADTANFTASKYVVAVEHEDGG